jgi:uncharacterized protein (UPF0333 family)
LLVVILNNTAKKVLLSFLRRVKNRKTFSTSSNEINIIFGRTGCAEIRNENRGNVTAIIYAFCFVV